MKKSTILHRYIKCDHVIFNHNVSSPEGNTRFKFLGIPSLDPEKKIGRSNHLPAKFSPRAAAKEAVAKRSAQSPQCSRQFQWRIIPHKHAGRTRDHSNQADLTHTMKKISNTIPIKKLQDTTRMRLIYPFRRTIRHNFFADSMPCD